MKTTINLFLLIITSTWSLLAQVAIVKDINTSNSNSPPGGFIGFQDVVYFNAFEPATGSNMWVTDGTEQGTSLFLDGKALWDSSLIIDETLYMYMSAETSNGIDRELYKTDGTANGTELIKNINPNWHSDIEHMVNLDGILIFSADDGVNGKELWRSDGTESGTFMIKNISPGDNSSYPAQFVQYNNKLYFYALDNTSVGLWSTDGTTAGTIKIKALGFDNSDYSDSPNGTRLVKSNNILFFANIDDQLGWELWKSDGTENGTVLVKDINTISVGNDTRNSNPNNLIDINGTLFFQATTNELSDDYALWKSDGTEGGTVEIINIWTGSSPFWNRGRNFVKFQDLLYFVGSDELTGAELWKSDGTENGTVLVKDLNQNSVPGQAFASDGPKQLTVVNNILYFAASNGNIELLYQTDGTTNGTIPVPIENSNNSIISPKNMEVANGKLFFAGDNNPEGESVGDALWSSVNSNLSIEPSKIENNISIYPNPVNDMLHIETKKSESIISIELFNILGNKIETIFFNNKINVSNLVTGIYYLRINTEKGVFRKKIIKR